MNASSQELRAAIEHAEFWQKDLKSQWVEPLLDAARERLAQLEADPELVERIAAVLWNHEAKWSEVERREYLRMAENALAAIGSNE